ncbi:insulinase family protein [Candidatus Falkowbacteria bacterium]|jgi:predicted Zn-dependent peptidase|nr:insulinase family protein [Candidatus Falkowbacteria bacterium]MBT5503853.1 insulinase family protein [Candidatus Falkowbacteria bacterium]MBT6574396.1 insulinase family protein [Candidatus Falkowbacteria bacterium]MBT7348913.1 insulinase family protein [Candidatus Falkowbacteria bacterium]MBT7501269.1 insulinase family protein [Candidatus Falkowbacteria bacterium]
MYKKIVFPNKTRLILVPSKHTKATTVFFLYGVGSRYESREINGASHFLEHLMFKGTKKRPTTLDISRELDRVGAEFNAMTSKDYTGYYVKINHEKQDLAIDVLSDMLLNSKFEPVEINRERGVIVEEINMYHDNPLMSIEGVLESMVFKGNTLGWEIAGPASVIKKVSRKQLLDYKNKYYRPDNLVIAVAGRANSKIQKVLEEKFIKKSKKGKLEELIKFKPFTVKQKQPQVKVQFRDTKQVQLALGFPAYGYNSPKTYAMHLLSIILGGNMSSRLFISVRERRGLCYFVRCYPSYYQDTGNMYIQSGLDVSRLDEAIQVILGELRKIKNKGVTAKELSDAKEFLRGKIVLTLEDSSSMAEYYAKQEILTGKTMSPEVKLKKYQAVTEKEVQNLAKELFVKEKLNLALIGPFKSDKKFYKQIKL